MTAAIRVPDFICGGTGVYDGQPCPRCDATGWLEPVTLVEHVQAVKLAFRPIRDAALDNLATLVVIYLVVVALVVLWQVTFGGWL